MAQQKATVREAGRLRGAANIKAAEIITKYIITDLYAKAIGRHEWAYEQIAKVYV